VRPTGLGRSQRHACRTTSDHDVSESQVQRTSLDRSPDHTRIGNAGASHRRSGRNQAPGTPALPTCEPSPRARWPWKIASQMLRRRLGAGLAQSLTADGALSCARGHMRSGPYQTARSPAHALTAAPSPRGAPGPSASAQRAQSKLFERNRHTAEDSDAELHPASQLSGVFPPPRPVSTGETRGISPVLSATLRAAA
jgi:hypothetical protein